MRGDVLQIPPIEKGGRHSLAHLWEATEDAMDDIKENEEKDNEHESGFVQGNQLWRSVQHVIQLTVNNRADQQLEVLRFAMRNKTMDDKTLNLLCSRVLGVTRSGPLYQKDMFV